MSDRHRIRVRYGETDQMGVAHHGSYIAWIEEARTEWLRARGKSYRDWEAEGYLLQIVEVKVHYLAPSRYDDLLCIETHLKEKRPASLTLAYEITRQDDGTEIAKAETRLACVDREGRPRRLPAGLC